MANHFVQARDYLKAQINKLLPSELADSFALGLFDHGRTPSDGECEYVWRICFKTRIIFHAFITSDDVENESPIIIGKHISQGPGYNKNDPVLDLQTIIYAAGGPLKEIAKLQQKNAMLTEENAELRLRPGGPDYENAKLHFEEMAEKQ